MEYYLGEILLLAFPFAPVGSLKCDGTILQVSQNQALYSLIGNQYGGTFGVNFALPNLSDASPVQGMDYYIMATGIYPQRP